MKKILYAHLALVVGFFTCTESAFALPKHPGGTYKSQGGCKECKYEKNRFCCKCPKSDGHGNRHTCVTRACIDCCNNAFSNNDGYLKCMTLSCANAEACKPESYN